MTKNFDNKSNFLLKQETSNLSSREDVLFVMIYNLNSHDFNISYKLSEKHPIAQSHFKIINIITLYLLIINKFI